MSDSQRTRIVSLARDFEREELSNTRTHVTGAATRLFQRVTFHDYRHLFNGVQRELHATLSAQPAPGVLVCAADARGRVEGTLWLSATESLRAGTVGRHGLADLPLLGDDGLSLRHLLVLAHRDGSRIRLRAMDLATPGGFQAETGGVLRAVQADGPVVLRVASYSLFLFPTGARPPWNPDAADPWRTLPPRLVLTEERARPRPVRERPPREPGSGTVVTLRPGPIEPGLGPEPLLLEHELPEGALVLSTPGGRAELGVGATALERGLLLGRYARCAASTGEIDSQVSRVHAALLRHDGRLFLVDTASTNGITLRGEKVKCAPVQVGDWYAFGDRLRVKWEIVH